MKPQKGDAEFRRHEGAHPGKKKARPRRKPPKPSVVKPIRPVAVPDAGQQAGSPPAPTSRWLNPPWCRTHLYVAWGFASGQFTPEQLAARGASCGVGALAVQHTPENRDHQAEARDACHRHGLAYMVWERSDQTLVEMTIAMVRELQPDAYLADVEGPMRDPTFPARFAQWFPDLPKAMCATGAIDQSFPGTPGEVSAHWISAGFDLTMQDYFHVNPNATPDRAENFAYWRGWPAQPAANGHLHVPVVEVRAEGSPPLAEQLPLLKPWGRAFGIYTAEYLDDSDYVALRGVA